jgi:hypothetical protein
VPEVFKKELYFERYLGGMTVIKLNEEYYVQPKAILILQKERALTNGTSADVQAEWEASHNSEADYYSSRLLPAIKIMLTDQRDIMLHFGSEAARDEQLAELVKQWKEE